MKFRTLNILALLFLILKNVSALQKLTLSCKTTKPLAGWNFETNTRRLLNNLDDIKRCGAQYRKTLSTSSYRSCIDRIGLQDPYKSAIRNFATFDFISTYSFHSALQRAANSACDKFISEIDYSNAGTALTTYYVFTYDSEISSSSSSRGSFDSESDGDFSFTSRSKSSNTSRRRSSPSSSIGVSGIVILVIGGLLILGIIIFAVYKNSQNSRDRDEIYAVPIDPVIPPNDNPGYPPQNYSGNQYDQTQQPSSFAYSQSPQPQYYSNTSPYVNLSPNVPSPVPQYTQTEPQHLGPGSPYSNVSSSTGLPSYHDNVGSPYAPTPSPVHHYSDYKSGNKN